MTAGGWQILPGSAKNGGQVNQSVTLSVNGEDYAGWKSVRIESGLERAARSFELSVTDSWPGNSDHIRRINPGDLVEVRIGPDLVCTGYVDATPVDYDANGYTIMIRGRSKTADLIDCSADNSGAQFKGLRADQIAQQLAGQYGVGVVVETDTGAAITDHQIQQGETVFESLDRIAKQRQILITDDANGNLLLASPGSGGHADSALELGVNILTGSAGFDFSDVYSKYSVKGQKTGTDDSYGNQASQSLGVATDSAIKRQRVLIVRQSGQADAGTCQQRAQYEAQIRQAKAGEVRYRIAGWRQQSGQLWRVNQTLRVIDALMRIDADLLISEVNYTLDESGELVELVVVPPAAFLTVPEQAAKAVKRKKSKAGTAAGWID